MHSKNCKKYQNKEENKMAKLTTEEFIEAIKEKGTKRHGTGAGAETEFPAEAY